VQALNLDSAENAKPSVNSELYAEVVAPVFGHLGFTYIQVLAPNRSLAINFRKQFLNFYQPYYWNRDAEVLGTGWSAAIQYRHKPETSKTYYKYLNRRSVNNFFYGLSLRYKKSVSEIREPSTAGWTNVSGLENFEYERYTDIYHSIGILGGFNWTLSKRVRVDLYSACGISRSSSIEDKQGSIFDGITGQLQYTSDRVIDSWEYFDPYFELGFQVGIMLF
jgi:hypothetical protein